VRDSHIVVQAFSVHLQPEMLHHKRTIPHGYLDKVSCGFAAATNGWIFGGMVSSGRWTMLHN
jgi:hypothetical protein